MTRTFVFLWLTAAMACGGKSAPAAEPAPPIPTATPCERVSTHLAELMAGQEDEVIGPEHHPVIAKIFAERCAADGWAADIVECMRASDLKTFDACAQQLTQVQRDALENQFERDLKPLVDARWKQTHPMDDLESGTDLEKTGEMPPPPTPAAAPPAPVEEAAPPPPPKSKAAPKRSAPRPKADDPCGGGA